MFNPYAIKKQFPIFKNHSQLVYLDNAATTQKPQAVIDAMIAYYTHYTANVGRGLYSFGEQATQSYESARATVAHFIGAQPHEIVFVKNATEGINLVASSWAMQHVHAGDAIALTEYEHHANMLPWQRVVHDNKAHLNYIPICHDGQLDYHALAKYITSGTKLLACSSVSNATGMYADIAQLVQRARAVGALVLLDAAQQIAHERIDVKALDVDFMVFSGHKIFGPTGIGVLYIKDGIQKEMIPYQVGGATVFEVDWHHTTFAQSPYMFEAGTPPIAQAIGLAAALDWLLAQDFVGMHAHEITLINQLVDGLQAMPHITVIGCQQQLRKNSSLVSFVVKDMHGHDVAAYLNNAYIAVRAGHHCAQPLAKKMGIDASVRASVACYNTPQDINKLLAQLSYLGHTQK